MVFISASLCQALTDYTVTAPYSDARFDNGGMFEITSTAGSFFTFCLETGEYVSLNTAYPGTIDSKVYYGTASGQTIGSTYPSGEALNTNTINLYDYFLQNYGTLTHAQDAEIQEAVWYFQGQISYTPSGNPYTSGTYTGPSQNVEALNLWTADGGQYTTADAQQSFLIVGGSGTSVPEPSIVVLVGLGLVGVAGIRRKFQK